MTVAGVNRSWVGGRIGEGAAGFRGQLSKDDGPTDETPAVGDGSANQVGARGKDTSPSGDRRHRATGKRVANLPQRNKKTGPACKFVFKTTLKPVE